MCHLSSLLCSGLGEALQEFFHHHHHAVVLWDSEEIYHTSAARWNGRGRSFIDTVRATEYGNHGAPSINFNQFLEKEKLKGNGSNFTDWSRHVRIFLTGVSMQYVLEAPLGPPPPPAVSEDIKNVYETRVTRYSEIQCAILCSLEAELQKRFEHHDPCEMMRELKLIFETHAAVESYEASKQFFNCMMEEGSSVSEHMFAMSGHAKKLSDLGIVIPNKLGIHRVLQSLPPSYKNFVMNYNMQNMNKELPELFSMLKSAEVEIKKENQVLMVNKTTSFKKQGKPNKGNFKKGGKKVAAPPEKPKAGPKPETVCYYCQGKGHWKRNCTKYLADLKSGHVKKKETKRASSTPSYTWHACEACDEALRAAPRDGASRALVIPGSTVLAVARRWVSTPTHSRTPGGTIFNDTSSTTTISPSTSEMAKDTIPSSSEVAEETPVTYGDLTGELKKKYDEIKSALEADLIGSFHRTRSHGIRWKGFTPEGALDGVDLSTPSEERTRSLRQEINFMVAHSLHRHSESLVNTTSPRDSPRGSAAPFPSPLPFALAAPEAPNSSAFVVYKIGGDPSDYQFLQDAPKEIPHGYACAYVPDSTWAPSNQVAGTSGATEERRRQTEKQTWLAKYATPTKLPSPAPAVGSEPEKQAWLVKYATPTNLQGSAPAAITADQICTILKDQFGMMPKRKAIGYTKPYPNEYELIPLPPKYRLPDFTKFSGSDGSSSIEHVSRYLAQLGMISASDELRVRYFSQSLTGSAFGWYTSLPPNSIQTWKQLEEQFHEQYHSEASEAGIADLAQVRQKRGETVSEYIQRFRTVRNRCYSVHVSEKEAVELAVVGLSSSIKEVASQADYPSLAHMVQKLSAYEQRHPDIYQDKFKRVVTMVDAGEDEGPTGEREVAVAEWTRAAGPVTCKWVKPPGPPRGFDFDVTKTEQIFDLLLAEKHIKVPEGHKFPTVQELNGKPYCKWHNTFTHTTNDCRVWRQQIQVAIENGRLIFNQYAMKVDTHPFPAVNMVEFTHLGGCQPDFSANISMVELGHRSEKDGDEDSCSQSKDTEGAAPCDRLRQDGKRYVTEGEVKNIRYQRPLLITSSTSMLVDMTNAGDTTTMMKEVV
ncbi:hypothetical protein QYE76_032609 [Lolium multiflorum]|uniref:CCHC-type domain-containing protein n=1 Tax=Lolium multiflorum TaxID=4521 RepID=A0AAD8QVG5_LOLMU|nr:hypothetical protein QYE76_032609 [Lolium multiflorum]